MYLSKLVLNVLPNIHLIAMFITVFTLVFRKKALIPIYIFVFLTGLYEGFGLWWIPYLYIWTILWGVIMLLPKNMPKPLAAVVYSSVCALHGFLFGVMYAPAQALLFGLDLKGTVAWIAAGLPFDIAHGLGDLLASLMIIQLTEVMKKALKMIKYN